MIYIVTLIYKTVYKVSKKFTMPDLRTLEITIDFNQDGPSLCCDLINVAENTVTVGMLKYLIICVSVWSLCF